MPAQPLNQTRSNLRVLLYTDADTFAGTERHMLDLARSLSILGIAVTLACPEPSALREAALKETLPVCAIQKHGLIDRVAVKRLRDLLRSGEIDIVHAHNGRTALIAALAARRAGRGRCVMTQHFLEPNHATQRGPKAVLTGLAHHWVMRQMSAIVAVSEAARTAMLARGEAPAAQIRVVPNGIAPPAVVCVADETRKGLGIAADALLVVCVARLEPEKDIGSLIRAISQVHDALPAARCLVAGDGSLRAGLEEQIACLGLTGVVRLLGFQPDAPAIIAAADVFALPSLAEPFGLVLLEAMAQGKPVIATQAGGPLEIVADGETGLLVPPASPEALAEAIQSLLDDPAKRRRLGEDGRTRFQNCFTAEKMAQATAKVYQQVTGK